MPPTTVSISWDLPPLDVPQHPDQHRPHRPILFAVDQQLGECAALPVSPDLLEHSGADDPVPTRDEDQAVQRPDDRRPLQTPVLRTLEEPRRASATGRSSRSPRTRRRSGRGPTSFDTRSGGGSTPKFKEALVFPAEVDLTSRESSSDVSCTWADEPPAHRRRARPAKCRGGVLRRGGPGGVPLPDGGVVSRAMAESHGGSGRRRSPTA